MKAVFLLAAIAHSLGNVVYDDDCDPIQEGPTQGTLPAQSQVGAQGQTQGQTQSPAQGTSQTTLPIQGQGQAQGSTQAPIQYPAQAPPPTQGPTQGTTQAPPAIPVPIERAPCSVTPYDRAYRTKMNLAIKYMYDGSPPDTLIEQLLNRNATSNAPNSTEVIPLINQDNDAFLVPVTLATGQKFNIDIDTGSADTWFRGPNCTASDGPCTGTQVNKNDTGLEIFKLAFITQYGSGTVVGQIAKANVTVGDNIPVRIPIGISRVQDGLAPSDGILGLGFDATSSISKKINESANYMDALQNATGTSSSIAFYLSTNSSVQGSIVFGGVDTSKFVGTFSTVPVNGPKYWQFDFSNSKFKIGDSGPSFSLAGRFKNAVVDSGTSLMIIDSKIADDINKKLGAVPTNNGDGMAKFPNCDAGLRGPTLTMNVAGVNYPVPPSIYVVKNAGECFSGFAGMGTTPSGTLIADDATNSLAILGGTFMKAVYVNFDKTKRQLQFAQSVNSVNQTSSALHQIF